MLRFEISAVKKGPSAQHQLHSLKTCELGHLLLSQPFTHFCFCNMTPTTITHRKCFSHNVVECKYKKGIWKKTEDFYPRSIIFL